MFIYLNVTYCNTLRIATLKKNGLLVHPIIKR
nr:MAG TPA: hypothetical protein [Caudoviricetes sp.]